jgi:hypothetical protein
MNSTLLSGPDAARSRLRATVATIERDISRLPRQLPDDDSKSPLRGLLASFADLVEQLQLGPEPELRECPVCGHSGMRAATLCGYCWAKLIPPTEPLANETVTAP